MTVEMPRVDGVRHRYVEVDGLLMHVAEAGEGEPVVLLHGWPENWYLWRKVIPALAPHFRVICPDLRGHGWTEAPRRGYHKEQLATDVLGLMDALELDRVRLAGHDWGGWTGFLMCLRQPERIEQFIALNISPPWLGVSDTLRNAHRFWYMAFMASGLGGRILMWSPAAFKRGILRAKGERGGFTAYDLEVFIDSLATTARARASVQMYRTLMLKDAPDMVLRRRYADQRLKVPTLLLFGAQDVAIGVDMVTGFEGHADDMRLELVPEAGHFIVDEQPDLVIDRALEFFGAPVMTPALAG